MLKAGDKVKFKEAADAKVTGLDPNGVYTVNEINKKRRMVQLVGVQGNFYISRFTLAEEPIIPIPFKVGDIIQYTEGNSMFIKQNAIGIILSIGKYMVFAKWDDGEKWYAEYDTIKKYVHTPAKEPKPRDARDGVVRGIHPSDRFAWARANAQMANFQMQPPEMVFNAVIKLEGMKAEDAPRINISGKSEAVKAVLEHLKLVKFHHTGREFDGEITGVRVGKETFNAKSNPPCSECTRNADESLECFECSRDFYFGKGKTKFSPEANVAPKAYPYTCDKCIHEDPRCKKGLEEPTCKECFDIQEKGNFEAKGCGNCKHDGLIPRCSKCMSDWVDNNGSGYTQWEPRDEPKEKVDPEPSEKRKLYDVRVAERRCSVCVSLHKPSFSEPCIKCWYFLKGETIYHPHFSAAPFTE